MAKSVLTNSPWSAHYLYTKSNGSNHNKQAAMLIIFQLILLKKRAARIGIAQYWDIKQVVEKVHISKLHCTNVGKA